MVVKLNNFILWCKGWYVSVNNEDIYRQAQKALSLDGYLVECNVIYIVLNYIDELIQNKKIEPFRLSTWHDNIARNMLWYNVNYKTALLNTIVDFFCYEFENVQPPIYSRKLYKLGFVAPKHFGNSYKMQNYKVNKFFKKRTKNYGDIR